jgi:hypothetical protein
MFREEVSFSRVASRVRLTGHAPAASVPRASDSLWTSPSGEAL